MKDAMRPGMRAERRRHTAQPVRPGKCAGWRCVEHPKEPPAQREERSTRKKTASAASAAGDLRRCNPQRNQCNRARAPGGRCAEHPKEPLARQVQPGMCVEHGMEPSAASAAGEKRRPKKCGAPERATSKSPKNPNDPKKV